MNINSTKLNDDGDRDDELKREKSEISSSLYPVPKDPVILQSHLEVQKVHNDVTENRKIIEHLTRSNKWLEEMIEHNKAKTIEHSSQESTDKSRSKSKSPREPSPRESSEIVMNIDD